MWRFLAGWESLFLFPDFSRGECHLHSQIPRDFASKRVGAYPCASCNRAECIPCNDREITAVFLRHRFHPCTIRVLGSGEYCSQRPSRHDSRVNNQRMPRYRTRSVRTTGALRWATAIRRNIHEDSRFITTEAAARRVKRLAANLTVMPTSDYNEWLTAMWPAISRCDAKEEAFTSG